MPEMPAYAIELRRVAELVPYAGNSRTHDDIQRDLLRRLIDEVGWTKPVIVRGETIAAGHGAVLVAEEIYRHGGLIYPAPGRDAGARAFPPGTVPVIDASGWSAEQLRAYVIADNQIPLRAGWDWEVLRMELGDLHEVGFELELTGFDAFELETLLNGTAGAGAGEGESGAGGEPEEFRLVIASGDESELATVKRLLGVPRNQNKVSVDRVIGWLRDE